MAGSNDEGMNFFSGSNGSNPFNDYMNATNFDSLYTNLADDSAPNDDIHDNGIESDLEDLFGTAEIPDLPFTDDLPPMEDVDEAIRQMEVNEESKLTEDEAEAVSESKDVDAVEQELTLNEEWKSLLAGSMKPIQPSVSTLGYEEPIPGYAIPPANQPQMSFGVNQGVQIAQFPVMGYGGYNYMVPMMMPHQLAYQSQTQGPHFPQPQYPNNSQQLHQVRPAGATTAAGAAPPTLDLCHPQPRRALSLDTVHSDRLTRSQAKRRREERDPVDGDAAPPDAKRRRSSSSESSGLLELERRLDQPVYKALESRPKSWGQTRKFKYSATGELDHKIRMSVEEMLEFLLENPRQVTLRIGRTPLGCNDRYGLDNGGEKGGAPKCRFKCCLDRKGTMEKGTYRVILDEQRGSGSNPHHDPLHNAGYVHLWCLERWLDLPALVAHPKLNVVVDDGRSAPVSGPRDVKYGGVKLGSESERAEANRFLEQCTLGLGDAPAGYPRCTERGLDVDADDPHGPYEGTLGYRMAVRKRDEDGALRRHDFKRLKAVHGAKSRFRDHLYNLSVQFPGRSKTRRASGQKQIRAGARRRLSSILREHVARGGSPSSLVGPDALRRRRRLLRRRRARKRQHLVDGLPSGGGGDLEDEDMLLLLGDSDDNDDDDDDDGFDVDEICLQQYQQQQPVPNVRAPVAHMTMAAPAAVVVDHPTQTSFPPSPSLSSFLPYQQIYRAATAGGGTDNSTADDADDGTSLFLEDPAHGQMASLLAPVASSLVASKTTDVSGTQMDSDIVDNFDDIFGTDGDLL